MSAETLAKILSVLSLQGLFLLPAPCCLLEESDSCFPALFSLLALAGTYKFLKLFSKDVIDTSVL